MGASVCALIALFASVPAHAGTATTTARAITLRPLSLLRLRDLQFGNIAINPGVGTVTINPNTDARTVTGGVVATGGTVNAAQFYTYGGPLQLILITSSGPPVLNRSGGGATMNMTALTLNGPIIRWLDSAGLLDLRVGGTLNVGANQMEGAYTGTFQVTVTYF